MKLDAGIEASEKEIEVPAIRRRVTLAKERSSALGGGASVRSRAHAAASHRASAGKRTTIRSSSVRWCLVSGASGIRTPRTVLVISCDIAAQYPAGSGVGVSVLLRQPGSLEGFVGEARWLLGPGRSSRRASVDDPAGLVNCNAAVAATHASV